MYEYQMDPIVSVNEVFACKQDIDNECVYISDLNCPIIAVIDDFQKCVQK